MKPISYKPCYASVSKLYFYNQRLLNKAGKKYAHAGHTSIIRPMIEYIKHRYKGPLVGVEIGARDGFNLQYILETLNIKKLYAVDIVCNFKLDHNLDAFGDKVEFIKAFSKDAAQHIPDDLDFVYIDGDHTYQGVKDDIKTYFPKIKPGGVIGGHDYTIQHYGLVKAVSEFLMELKLEKEEIGEGIFSGHMFQDWWVIK